MAGVGHLLLLSIIQVLMAGVNGQTFSLSSTTTSITISWERNNNQADSFELMVPGIGQVYKGDGVGLRSAGSVQIPGLTPGFTYTIEVLTTTGARQARIFSQRETTVPGTPTVSIDPKNTTTVTINWKPDPASVDERHIFEYQVRNSGVYIPLSACPQYRCDLDVGGQGGSSVLFRLFAVSNGKQSAPGLAAGYTKPSPPERLDIMTRTTSSLTIGWSTTGSVSFYEVTVSPPIGVATGPSNVNQGWMYTRSGLIPGTQFTFSVVSHVGNLSSVPAQATFFTVPNPPGSLRRADRGNTVSLAVNWSKPDQGACDFVTASLTGGASMNNLVVNTTSFTGLTPGKLYNVSVICTVENNIQSVPQTRSFYTKPLPVTNIRAEKRTSNSVTITWDDSAIVQEQEKTVVELQGLPNSRQEIPSSQLGTSRSYTFTNLSPGTTYTAIVSKVSGDQTSETTTQAFITKPASPSGLKQTSQTTTSVSVSWTAVSNQSTITGYEIRIFLAGNLTAIPNATFTAVDASTVSYQFSNLHPATQYTVNLQSYLIDADGNRLIGDGISETVTTDPDPPTDITILSKVHTNLQFSWSPPSHPAENYVISVRVGDSYIIRSQVTASTAFQLTSGLKAGTTYTIEVSSRRYNRISQPAIQTVNLRPLPPENVVLVDKNTTSITLSWSSTSGVDVPQYTVEWTVGNDTRTVDFASPPFQVGGLSGGQAYTIHVYTKNDAGERSGDSVSLTATTLPLGVTNVTPANITATSITISWSQPTNTLLDYYNISITPNSGQITIPVLVSRNGPLNYTFTNLLPGNNYSFSVTTVSTNGGQGAPLYIMVTTNPAKVLKLAAKNITTSGMTVSWEVDPQSSQSEFRVSYKTEQYPVTTIDLNNRTTSSVLAGLLPGRFYRVNVTAVSNRRTSEMATILQATDPLPVTELQITIQSPTEATLTWTANANSVQDGYQYHYKVKGTNDWSSWVETITNSAIISQLMPGQNYDCEVKARSGDRSSTSTMSAFTLWPLPPSSVMLEGRTTTTVALSWEAPVNSKVASYVVEWMVNGQLKKVDVLGSSYSLTDLSAGEQYNISVFSKNGLGDRSITPATILATTLPFGVSNIDEESVTIKSVTISWSAPEATNLHRYEINIRPNYGQLSLPVTILKAGPLQHTFSNLLPGNTYNISIETVAADGGKGTPASIVVTTPPSKVTNLAINGITTSQMVVFWNIDGQSTQDMFKVAYRTQSSTTNILDVNSPTTTVTLSSLLPGRTYIVSVTAVSKGRSGENSTLTQAIDPLAVTGLKASAKSPTEVILTWSPNVNSQQDAYRYRYRIMGSSAWTARTTTLTTTVTEAAFVPGKTYEFEVEALSMDRTSATSTTRVTLLSFPPDEITLVRKSTTSIVVSWNPPPLSDVSAYKVEYVQNGQTKSITTQQREYELPMLSAGESYVINVYSVNSAGDQSSPASLTIATLPNGVTEFKLARATENSLIVEWSPPSSSNFDHYELNINPNHGQIMLPVSISKMGQRSYTFLSLSAGVTYNMSVETVAVDGGKGQVYYITATTLSLPPERLGLAKKTTTSLEVSWNPPSVSYVSGYRLEYISNGQSRTVDVQVTVFQINGLLAGEPYTVNVYSLNKDGERSDIPASINVATLPYGVSSIEPVAVTENSVKVSWSEPYRTNLDHYELSINPSHGQTMPVTVSKNGQRDHNFLSLRPGVTYNVSIQTVAVDGGKGTPLYTSSTTLSLPPRSATLVNKSTTAAMLEWKAPDGSEVAGYEVEWMVNGNIMKQEVTDTKHDISGLTAGEQYTVNIYSINSVKNKSSTSASITFTTLPFGVATITTGDKKTDSVTVSWPKPSNNNVDYYELRISPNDNKETLPIKVQGERPLTYTFTGLQAGNTYNISIQPVAIDGGKGTPITKSVTTENVSRRDLLLMIILPVVLGTLLLVGIAISLVCILWRTRRVTKGKDDDSDIVGINIDQKFSKQNVSMSTRRRGIGGASRPIRKAAFLEQYKKMSLHASKGFSEELSDLEEVGKNLSKRHAELPANKHKNRYRNVLPYDETRVKLIPLHNVDGSDYINASYVPGYNSRKEFIACQGPLPLESTYADFWRMVWEQNSSIIVMLTNFFQKGRVLCDRYWPVDTEPLYYGSVQVTVMNETISPMWTISDLRLVKGGVERKLTHFLYTAWPDFGVPSRPQDLVHFVRLVRNRVQPHAGPIIAHCSSGIGRTGTYIAVDINLQQLKEKETVDVFGTVFEMRLHRERMVQTDEQYAFIHSCLACVIEGKDVDPLTTSYGRINRFFRS